MYTSSITFRFKNFQFRSLIFKYLHWNQSYLYSSHSTFIDGHNQCIQSNYLLYRLQHCQNHIAMGIVSHLHYNTSDWNPFFSEISFQLKHNNNWLAFIKKKLNEDVCKLSYTKFISNTFSYRYTQFVNFQIFFIFCENLKKKSLSSKMIYNI